MSIKIYVAYGSSSDQVTALRLKALGAVNGLSVYVPPAITREDEEGLDLKSSTRLSESEIVVGVLTSEISQACTQEMALAKALVKRMIVICEPAWANQLASYSPNELLVLNPADPAQAESRLMSFLQDAKLKKETSRAILAMGTIALGLVLLVPAE